MTTTPSPRPAVLVHGITKPLVEGSEGPPVADKVRVVAELERGK